MTPTVKQIVDKYLAAQKEYEFEEVEVQIGTSSDIRCFKKVFDFKQDGEKIQFYYRDFDKDNFGRDENGHPTIIYYTNHADLCGKVVSKIERVWNA